MSDMKRCMQCGKDILAEEIGKSKTHKWKECKRTISSWSSVSKVWDTVDHYFEDHVWRVIEYFEEIEAAIQQQDEEGSGPVIVKDPAYLWEIFDEIEAERKERDETK